MVTVDGNKHSGLSANPGFAVCILYNANTVEKDMNPIILPPAMDKSYLPTPPLGQDMTHGQFLSGVLQV